MPQKAVSFVSHSACRTGAPLALLHILEHIKNPSWKSNVILLREGPLMSEFADLYPVSVVGQNELHTTRLAYQNINKKSYIQGLVLKYTHKNQPDLYYLNSHSFEFIYLAALYGVPVICHIHEVPASFMQLDKDLLSLFCNYPVRYIAASRYVKKMLTDDLGIDSNKVSIVSSGIDTNKWKPIIKDMNLLARLNIPTDALVIGASGQRIPLKGVDLWLQMASYLCDLLPEHNCHFVWVGEPSPCDAVYDYLMHSEARHLGLSDRVHFVGGHNDPRPYYSLFDICTVTSRTESLSLVCLELTLMGKPVVVCESAGGPKEFGDEGFVHLVDMPKPELFAKAVANIVLNPEEGKRLVSSGQDVIPRLYNICDVASQIEFIVDEVLRECDCVYGDRKEERVRGVNASS
ncbi:MAG: glycosyltransferase family 4 protein [Kiritimatiellales bacterium]|nr:glycosyltransferase family 4 protein [Kiritimatiellales bacterium]